MAEQTPFKDTRAYPVIFMIAVTVVFVGVLAAFQQTTENRVAEYKLFVEQATILKVFGLPAGKDVMKIAPAEVATLYAKCIQPVEKPDHTLGYYLCRSEAGDTLGYAYKIYGKGLWSTIGAFAAFSPDRTRLLSLEIVDEVETPGLGARIEEPWFKQQFAGKTILRDGKPVSFSLIPEGEKVLPNDDHISMITGATITSRAVTDMITAAAAGLKSGQGR
jgi:Na+-transporting NADH:ubiquinone oxidoreductase subunit C